MNLDDLVRLAEQRKQGRFRLSELDPNEWNELTAGARRGLGQQFSQMVNEGKVAGVVYVERDVENHHVYDFEGEAK